MHVIQPVSPLLTAGMNSIFAQECGIMLIYTVLVCAVVAIVYLIQLRFYRHSRHKDLKTV